MSMLLDWDNDKFSDVEILFCYPEIFKKSYNNVFKAR